MSNIKSGDIVIYKGIVYFRIADSSIGTFSRSTYKGIGFDSKQPRHCLKYFGDDWISYLTEKHMTYD